MIRVKICGITNIDDALTAANLGAWAVGFIFYKKSPRFVSPTQARKIIARLPPFITPVGVFVNENERIIKKTAALCRLQVLQFHGDESPQFCRRFKGFKVVKAFRVREEFSVDKINDYAPSAFLFDTYQHHMFGGTGKVFNWSLLHGIQKLETPVILSGGLNAENIRQAVGEVKPFAVDVSSGVEESPGKKSKKALEAFFKNIYF